jgi:hypothetical protein
MRSFVTPSAFAVERGEGYGVSILAFFTDPRYAAPKGLVNSTRPRCGAVKVGFLVETSLTVIVASPDPPRSNGIRTRV